MYLWKIENLKEDIRTKQLTEKDRFIYMFIGLIITYSIMNIMTLIASEDGNMWDVASSLLEILTIYLGTFLAFRANGGAMGVDFLGKYMSIAFVISLRFIPLYILISIIMGINYYFIFPNIEEAETTLLDTVLFFVAGIAMYWRIIKHIKDVKEIQ